MLNDILTYLAAADTAQFPLTWEICREFLERLDISVKVVAEFIPWAEKADGPYLLPV